MEFVWLGVGFMAGVFSTVYWYNRSLSRNADKWIRILERYRR